MKTGFQNLSPQTLRSLKDEELLSLTNYLRERIIHVPIGILPVQNAHSAYHVAALNNLYARAAELIPV